MQTVAFILAVFLFQLAVTPCSDGYTCSDKTESSQSHDHSEDEGDYCTPFCTCQCCGVSMAMPDVQLLPLEEPKDIFVYTFYYSFHYSHDNLRGVWHPPAHQ